jgi:hypothetical protein
MRRKLVIVLLSVLSIVPLAGFGGPSPRGNLSQRVWYYGKLVPFSELLDKGVVPQCHDASKDGIPTCYNTPEELAVATGLELPGVDRAVVEASRTGGTLAITQATYYAVVYENAGYGGGAFALSQSLADFRTIMFDNITSSIFVPSGAGSSMYYENINYGGSGWLFNASIDDLSRAGCNDMISSAQRLGY